MHKSLARDGEAWSGVVNDPEQGLVRADLTMDSGEYKLHYGPPRNCWLKGGEVYSDDKQIVLRFSESSGGISDDLYQGTMTIEKRGQNNWPAVVEKKAIGFKESFTLRK